MSTLFDRHKQRGHENGGFTLVEVIFYVLLLVLLFGVITEVLLLVSGTFQDLDERSRINQSAIFGIERVVREARNADDIVEGDSTFHATSSTLALSKTDDDGITVDKTITLENNTLQLDRNGADQGPLTPEDVVVTAFGLDHIQSSTSSEAVRIQITVHPVDKPNKDTTFYNTAVARGSYEQ